MRPPPTRFDDIANSLESRPSATHGESTDLPNDPGPKLDRAHNSRAGNNEGPDSTLGNKQQEAPPRTEEEQKKLQNGRDGVYARLKLIRLKEKGLKESS